ncbi:MAG TPA: TolC family protein [Longimicrobiales bacterium]|nr:TolC family protein [Longimicrobiales bacterium]
MRSGWWVALLVALVPSCALAQTAPLTLDRAVELAVERSRDIRDAELELESARRRVREAWGSVYPQVTANAMYTRNLTVPGSFMPRIFFDPDAGPDELVLIRFGSDNVWNFTMRAEQPLFRAAAFIGVGAAARYEALQREVVRGRMQAVVTRVRVGFYDVMLAEEGERLTENTVQRIRQTLDEMRKLERAGLSSSYDVLRLEVELANVEPALRRARNAAAAARRSLAVELGLEDLDGVAIEGSLLSVDIEAVDGGALAGANGDADPGAVREALALRSELRQLELTEELRRAELRAEQSEYLPQVSVFGTYSINAQQSGSPTFFASEAQRAYGRQVGVMVSMPLFSGMQRPARVAQRRAAIEQVRVQRAVAEDQVEHQIRTFADQVEEARSRAAAQRLGVRQAQRGFEIVTIQHREGMSSALELTDAEGALRQSEFNYAEAIYDYLVARARLDDAMGTVDTGGRVAIGAVRDGERQ